MALGPIEVLVVVFPGNEFNGGIIPELERLVENDTISIIDGLSSARTPTGGDVPEFEEARGRADADTARRTDEPIDSLISDEDIEEIAAGLEPEVRGDVGVREHVGQAIRRRDRRQQRRHGDELPGSRVVVDEVLAALAEIDDSITARPPNQPIENE